MATRNPANVIEFGKFNYGATMTDFVITADADISGEVNPGEEMEKVIEAMSQHGTFIGLSNHATGGTVFTVVLEGSSWADAAAVQVALRALGGNFATATVA
tara:strand:- start:3583 stop:3885 length:303 start_codon:yes stop_codon:yes gene_type:complete